LDRARVLVDRGDVEADKRTRPVERFGDAGRLLQILPPLQLHEANDLLGEASIDAGQAGAYDDEFLRLIGKIEIAVEAAAA
jgi:hypothetical protein